MPISSMPPPTSQRGLAACSQRPISALSTNAASDSGAVPASPALIGPSPTTVCSHSEVYGR